MIKRLWLAALLLGMVAATNSAYAQFRVLVTNDDGVGAPGIDAVVEQLKLNPNLEVIVVAPATNQSGTGDDITFPPGTIDVMSSTTASGEPATAIDGFPADTVLFGLTSGTISVPDLVVSGINTGQNITREVSEISGTVGAALTAARHGIPALAVSQGFGAGIDFGPAARYTANVVERLRRSKSFRKRMTSKNGLGRALVLGINFPNCTTGSVRGVEVVPLGDLTTITGYTLIGSSGGVSTFQLDRVTANAFASDCTSALEDPASDLEAMNNGFASVTPLNSDLTVDSWKLRRFRFLRKIPFDF